MSTKFRSFFIIILVALVAITGAPTVSAQVAISTAPEGFCEGGIAWQIPEGDEAVDPLCGVGTYQLDLGEGFLNPFENFQQAESYRNGREATYWFEPLVEVVYSTYLPVVLNPTPLPATAPTNFCEGNVPWVLADGQSAEDPGCSPPGIFQLFIQGENTSHLYWEQAETFRELKGGTYWFEPASWLEWLALKGAALVQ